MSPPRTAVAIAIAIAASLLLGPVGLSAPSASAAAPSAVVPAAQVILDWERTSIRTVYTENAQSVPVGYLYLGFTSLAMYDAVQRAREVAGASARAAAAQAAHDVLAEYFPGSQANLDTDLAVSLGGVPDGWAKAKGIRIGRRAAADMIESRVGDGRDDPRYVYAKPAEAGYWQPAPGQAMVAPWLGFVKPLVLDHVPHVDGPDPLTSEAYAREYDEVRRLGSKSSAERTAEQTAIATFFQFNPAIMQGDALARYLERHPMGLLRTARLWAAAHGAAADSVIECWRLKYDVGYWRPFEAIAGAGDDDNPATTPESGWEPLVPNPQYSDYASGHACMTSALLTPVRRMIGEDTALELRNTVVGTTRSYDDLTAIETEALDARIWGGLHFRDATEDGYVLGHRTARRVLRILR